MCGPSPSPLAFDHAAAEALALEAAGVFAHGLRSLLASASASVEKEWRQLAEERLRIEAEAARLEAGWAQLEARRVEARGPSARSSPSSSSGRGASAGSSPQSAKLTQLPDSVLAAAVSGRCESADEAGGHVLVDFAPGFVMHALEHFRQERESAPHAPASRQQAGGVSAGDLERQTQEMLAHYGVQGWVYRRTPAPEAPPPPTSLRLGKREYAVLPQARPDEATVLLDMFDSTVTVPAGWEVLDAGAVEGFDDAVASLARHGWGTSLLCVKNAEGGFSSYRTVLYTHSGTAGSRVSGDSKVVKALDESGRQFGFSKGMVLSGRLVICKMN